ncbi:hypothetical protein ACWFNE_00705 [Cellulomonas sp. NPDC055163]
MTEVVARYLQFPDVEFGVYVLVDVLAPESPLERSGVGPGEDRLVSPAPYGVALHSAGNDFAPSVELRVLSGEPDDGPADDGPAGIGPGGSWERVATVEFEATSGTVRLASVNGVPGGEDVRLPARGRYAVRVRCRGRAEVAALRSSTSFFTGVEEWSLDLWPR